MIPPGLKCRDCGQPLNEKTQGEFVGRPDDFAHNSWACMPRMRELVKLQTRALLEADNALEELCSYSYEGITYHRIYKTVDAALTAAGLPDQASRDSKRAAEELSKVIQSDVEALLRDSPKVAWDDAGPREPLAQKTVAPGDAQMERLGYVILGDQADVARIEARHPELTFAAKPDGTFTKTREVWRPHDGARGYVKTAEGTRQETDEEFAAHLKELEERPR